MELQYLSTKAQRDSTLAQLEASMQSAKSSYEQLALAMENIDSHGNVIAPVDGVLASLTASEGGMVSPSYAVAVIDGAEQMKVTVMVSEALVPKLAIGDTVTVRVSAADAEFDGVIRSVEKDRQSGDKALHRHRHGAPRRSRACSPVCLPTSPSTPL